MLKLGTQNVRGMYLGGQEVKRAYLGSELVFDFGGLPSGYTALEYIQSSGTQYINTGFKANGNTRLTVDIDILPTNPGVVGVFGGRDGGLVNTFSFWEMADTEFRMDYAVKAYTISTNTVGRKLIDQNKNVTTINGMEYSQSASTFQAKTPLTVFGINENNGIPDERRVKAKLYSCQIYDNGALVRNFVPCKSSTGAAGLYDMAGRKFYGNAGTGAFAAGPAV